MSLFGDFYQKPLTFKRNKKELMVTHSEDWNVAILSGSSELVSKEDPVKANIYIVLIIIALVMGLVLCWRLFGLQIVNGQQNSLLANNNKIRTTIIPAPRGAIYDRNGVLLARNVAQIDLVAVPKQLPDDQQISLMSAIIASAISGNTEEINKKLKDTKKSNQPEEIILTKIDREQSLQLEEKMRDLPGLALETTPQREYLESGLLAHFLGYIGRISAEEWKDKPEYRPVDVIGKSGIEKQYEDELRGVPGKEQVEVDATGRPIRLLARVEPKPGRDVVLSIDWDLEQQLYNAIKSQVERAGSKAGSGVILDPQTGEVLATVNYPTYDANLFAKGISQKDYDGLLNNDAKPLLNRVTSGNYPIGSVVKPFISAAALQEKVVSSNTSIFDKGKLEVPNIYDPSIVYTFKGWKPEGLGAVNLVRALQWSSDVYYYQVGGGYQGFSGLGEKRLIDWYEKFGFGARTGLDIAEESAGFMPGPDKKKKATGESWYVGDTYNIAIGQGDMRATPMQLAVANSAIANGGKIIKPHLLKSVTQDKSLMRTSPAEIIRSDLISQENLALIKQGMIAAVADGTACCSIKNQVPTTVAGKTGTAETSSEGFDGKNPRTKPHAWFTSFAPADNPRIATVIMVENSGEGAEFAVPATREVLRWYFLNR